MIFSFISSIFGPVANLVDDLHTSDEERLRLRNELAAIERDVKLKALEVEAEFNKARGKVIAAEVKSDRWLVASWRPLCSIMLVGYIVIGPLAGHPPDENVYSLAQIFLGVYGASRGLEKVSRNMRK